MVICLERRAGLHVAQLMSLPLTVSCFTKIQIGFSFLVPTHLGSPRKRVVKWVCVCVLTYCIMEKFLAVPHEFLIFCAFKKQDDWIVYMLSGRFDIEEG